LTFALPRAATKDLALFYSSAHGGAFGSVPLSGSLRVIRRATSSTAAGPVTNTFPTTGGVGDPWGTAVDSGGNVWFAEPGCDFAPTCSASAGPGQIGELTASSHTFLFYRLPNITGNQPIFLAFDDLGNLWFTTPDNSMIGEFNPLTAQFVGQWPVTAGSGPWDLTFAGGKIWYTEHLISAVGSFDPVTHAYQDFQTPTANSNPYGIAANGGLIWFTENNSSVDRVAVLDSANSNAISEYQIVLPVSGTPHLITIGAGGNPWWTEGWSNTIATLNPGTATPGQCGTTSGTCTGVQRFRAPAPSTCSNSGSHTSGIAFQGSAGLVWFDNSLTAQVGSFSPMSNAFAMNTLSNCGAHPHDGLNLDAAGNVWFDEEFANAIGELIPSAPTAAYPRPKGATPTSVSLVPAYAQCTSTNDTHGAPLVFGSCNPPQQSSDWLTVGTPDANGQGAKSVGSVRYQVVPDDVQISVSTTDVRSKSDLSDYTGELQADQTLRITDGQNGPSQDEAGTMQDIQFPVTLPCSATANPMVGSTCAVSTSANAVMPGSVIAGKRAIWELGQVQVFDGGASGTAGASDATLFEDEGVFVP
jgi:streptogramin lyase